MISILNSIVILVGIYTAKAELPEPDFSYSVDTWLVREYDYGFVTISLARYGEPAIAPYGLSVTISCHNTDDDKDKGKKIIFPEATVCDFEKYTFNKDSKNLILQFQPLNVSGDTPKCGRKEMREFSLKKFCKLQRSPATKTMPLKHKGK